MTAAIECQEARVSLGVYVLGAIDPAERTLVDAHVAACRECRDELAGLAGLPALLARVSEEEASALAVSAGPPPAAADEAGQPPRELLATVLDLTAARRRRRLARVGLGAAAALIVAAGVLGGMRLGAAAAPPSAESGLDYPGPASGPWHSAATAAGGMSATVAYRPMGWGTQLAVKVSGVPVGTACQLWVLGRDGSRTLAGSWVTDNREGAVWYPGSAGLAASGVRGFTVTVGKDRVLALAT